MSRADVWIRRVLIGAAALSFSAPLARAQIPTQATVTPAPIASPSVIGREVMQEVPQRQRAEIEVPPAGGLTVTPELATREVEFAHVTIAGATAFGAPDFAPVLAPILNRRLRFAEVVAALNRIAALYEKGGYVFYSLVLPKQDLDGRELKVVVVEGSVSGVEVQDGIKSEAVRERIAALLGKLRGRKPLKRSELERQLLLAADTPGVALHASAKPDPSAADKVVLVVSGTFERFEPVAQVDSFSTVPDTSVNFRVGGIVRSLLTGGDQLEGRYLFSMPWDRLQLFDVRYGLPIGLDGGRLSFLGQAVWQQPPATFNGQSIYYQARSLLGRMQYSYPIVRHLDWTLMALGMLDVIDVDYNIAGTGIPGDSLRVMRGGMTTAFKDDWKGTWGAAALASVGLDLAGAETANRFSAAPSFFKLNLALERAQPIGKSFTFVARAVGQITSGTVPAAEVFTYGGREFGRAFNLSESFGDRGAAVSAELRYAIDWIDFLKDKADPQLYVYADHGWLSSDDPRNAPLFTQASSAGGGIRVIGFKRCTAELEFAKALDATPSGVGGRPWRVSVRVGTKF
ncbi:MAG: ShlB/FhaC/HecB family hemolysin secretion/activation protein [Reyranellales bacterium]